MNDIINHPTHYADGWTGGAEVIDITEHLNFCRGNAIKYLARAGKKDPSKELEDLKKARWYIDREIQRLDTDPIIPPGTSVIRTTKAEPFFDVSEPRKWERWDLIPADVSEVVDKDGDTWTVREGPPCFPSDYAPYTEVD
ncbi:DUF3310 domain-containing protein [Nocardia goodfellowii]